MIIPRKNAFNLVSIPTYGLYCYDGLKLTNIRLNEGNIGTEKAVRHIRKSEDGTIDFLTRSKMS